MQPTQPISPKRNLSAEIGRQAFYRYYAGFSTAFANSILSEAKLPPNAHILDPWNGGGITTLAAAKKGIAATGIDLNPAMVVIAKGRLLCGREKPSIIPLSVDVVKKARAGKSLPEGNDPLCEWFVPNAARDLREVYYAIQTLLIQDAGNEKILSVDELSGIAAFFLTALFRTVRNLVAPFLASNPTWIKSPSTKQERLRPSFESILSGFASHVKSMAEALEKGDDDGCLLPTAEVAIKLGSSANMPVGAETIDLALSSPPYCTRIDYAIATRPELAVLQLGARDFDALRRGLLGTSTVPKKAGTSQERWGEKCNDFIARIESHPSKASGTYYLKNHIQYFAGLYQSLQDVHRVLKPSGMAILVAQDSYYKEVHNDLPGIIREMSENIGFESQRRVDFRSLRNMARINPAIKQYRKDAQAVESVIWLSKQ